MGDPLRRIHTYRFTFVTTKSIDVAVVQKCFSLYLFITDFKRFVFIQLTVAAHRDQLF